MIAPSEEERVGANKKRRGTQLGKSGKRSVELRLAAGVQDVNLLPGGCCRRSPKKIEHYLRLLTQTINEAQRQSF